MQLFDLHSEAVSSNRYKLCTYSVSSFSFYEIHVCFLFCSEVSMYAEFEEKEAFEIGCRGKRWRIRFVLHIRVHLLDIKAAPFRSVSCCCIPLWMWHQRSKTWIWVFHGSALIANGMGVASHCSIFYASHRKCLPAPAPRRVRGIKGQYGSFANT